MPGINRLDTYHYHPHHHHRRHHHRHQCDHHFRYHHHFHQRYFISNLVKRLKYEKTVKIIMICQLVVTVNSNFDSFDVFIECEK